MQNAETLNASESGIGETPRGRRILRSIWAVLAGMLAVVVLSIGTDGLMHAIGVFPALGQSMAGGLFVLATAYRTVYSVAGGYVVARLAPDRPMGHALLLGFLGLAVCIAGLVATWNSGPELGPRWYPIALVVTSLPCAWAGARLRLMQMCARSVA